MKSRSASLYARDQHCSAVPPLASATNESRPWGSLLTEGPKGTVPCGSDLAERMDTIDDDGFHHNSWQKCHISYLPAITLSSLVKKSDHGARGRVAPCMSLPGTDSPRKTGAEGASPGLLTGRPGRTPHRVGMHASCGYFSARTLALSWNAGGSDQSLREL